MAEAMSAPTMRLGGRVMLCPPAATDQRAASSGSDSRDLDKPIPAFSHAFMGITISQRVAILKNRVPLS
jgi:hypothetical protein